MIFHPTFLLEFKWIAWKSQLGKLEEGCVAAYFSYVRDAWGGGGISMWFWLQILHLDKSRFYETPFLAFSKLHYFS